MNNLFIEASRRKLRLTLPTGLVSVERLWDMTITELEQIAEDIAPKLNGTYKSYLNRDDYEDLWLAFKIVQVIRIDKIIKTWENCNEAA